MSAFTVVCPACRASLRSARHPSADRMLRCPQCGGHFPAFPPVRYPHEPVAETSPPANLLSGAGPRQPSPYRMLLPAVLLAVLLSGGMVAVVLLLAGGRKSPAPAVAESQESRASAADRGGKPDAPPTGEDLPQMLARGREALAAGKFAEAEKAFAAALKLAPDGEDALRGLRETHAAMDRADPAAKAPRHAEANGPVAPIDESKSDDKKSRDEYRKRMESGRAAMDAERYREALAEYRAALGLVPGDNAAQRGVEAAQARLDDGGDKGKDRGGFVNLVDKARAAFKARKYDEAVADLKRALELSPGDPDARQLLQDVTKARRSARADYERQMARADAARAAGRFEEAARGYADALQAFPDDEDATKALRAVQGVAVDLTAGQVAYQRYLTQAALAMQNLQYADAVRAYAEALRLVPGDLVAAQGLSDARAALQLLAQRQIDFDAAMRSGNAALRARQFADGVRAFTDAQRLFPDSTRAALGLRQARFSKAMSDGQSVLTARRFGDAVRAFEEALREMPGDPGATAGLAQARAMQRR